jgi:phospholipid/cholesterol/gamma-HCH transport system substrate-binding protein
METGSPPITRIATMVLFALSCVGLLLFLWLSFGGTIPFAARGYEFRVSFPNAQELATQADVRIAGVSVGRVVSKELDPQGNRTIATIEMDNRFAPVHKDARAILREKTILGETYVELTPGTPHSPTVADGGVLGRGQVQPAVQLDQIFNAFDPTTRRAFQVWQQELARALAGNDQNLNSVLGNLPHFAADATDVVQVLDVQRAALVNLVANGGTVFGALSHSQAALRNLITSGEATFATTAANNQALADTFHVFPTFLKETRTTMARLQTFALNTDPLIRALVPVAQQLGPTLHAVQVLSPDLHRLFVKLGPLVTASKTGLPAIRDVLLGATPLLGALGPFLEQLNPILGWLSLHQQLISDFISNGASGIAGKTTTFGGTGVTCGGVPCGHYLRQFGPTGIETLTLYQSARDANNRGNTYPPSLWLADPRAFSAGGKYPDNFALPAWDCKNTGAPGDGSKPVTGSGTTAPQACWVAPLLPGATGRYKIPEILQATYSSK